jgi:uncharacterized protein (TIGR03437 family)
LLSLSSVSAFATDTRQNLPLRFEQDGPGFVARGVGFSFRLLPGRVEMQSVIATMPGGVPEGMEPLGVANHFHGTQVRTGVPVFGRVRYRAVYPGIDVVFYGAGRTLEYDIEAAAGSRPEAVRFRFSRPVTIRDGELELGDGITWRRPRAFQEREVAAAFVMTGRDTVGFALGAYDRARALTIDPVVTYASYIGTNCTDDVRGVALDPQGALYVVGTGCAGLPNPVVSRPFAGGETDAFVAKFTADGKLAYTTYLGGTGNDRGWGVTADAAGNAWVVGDASGDFPRTTHGGGYSATAGAFIVKLDTNGQQLLFAATDIGTLRAVTMDAQGNVYTAGQVSPVQNASLDPRVLKLTGNGTLLKTRMVLSPGHPYGEEPNGIAVDAAGAIYICGGTNSIQFPVTARAFQRRNVLGEAMPGSYTGYVAKIAADLDSMPWATYLGGTNQQSVCNGIALGKAGEVWLTGWTDASDFGSTAQTVQPRKDVTRQAFTARLSADGSDLQYRHTVEGVSTGSGIAVDAAGNAYVTGTYRDPSFPVTYNIKPPGTGSFNNGFLSRFVANGGLHWIASFGGTGWTNPVAIASDGGENVAIAGLTENSPKLLTADAAIPFYKAGTYDGFVARIKLTEMPNWAVVTAVVNGASFQAGPLAPGTWFTVYGSNLAAVARGWTGADFTNGGKTLPVKLDGVQILVNNVPALVAYISPTQINALAPTSGYFGDVFLRVVSADSVRGNDVKYTISRASPAFFGYDGRYVVAHVGNEFVGPAGLIAGLVTRPVRAGETITVYGTGFGTATPYTAPETVVAEAAPLAAPVTITIGGVRATVAYAGQIGSGLYQFNVVVPAIGAGEYKVEATVSGVATGAPIYLPVR